jgi:hypothetical protein
MAGAGQVAALLCSAVMLAACNTHTPAPAYTPTPAPTQPRSALSEPPDVVAFRAERNTICRKASAAVAAASVPKGGGSPESTAATVGRVADLTAATQGKLARLEPPNALRTFSQIDAARRRIRVRLLRQLADAIASAGDADAISARLTRLSTSAQAAETKHRLANCP